MSSSCHEMDKVPNKKGYVYVWIDKVSYGAHRVAYALAHGDPGSLMVCHSCDNRKCVNPEHLFLGTNQDNVDDMVMKGRQCKGTQKPGSKLTEQDVLEIRSSSLSNRVLGRKYSVSHKTISRIRAGLKWRNF